MTARTTARARRPGRARRTAAPAPGARRPGAASPRGGTSRGGWRFGSWHEPGKEGWTQNLRSEPRLAARSSSRVPSPSTRASVSSLPACSAASSGASQSASIACQASSQADQSPASAGAVSVSSISRPRAAQRPITPAASGCTDDAGTLAASAPAQPLRPPGMAVARCRPVAAGIRRRPTARRELTGFTPRAARASLTGCACHPSAISFCSLRQARSSGPLGIQMSMLWPQAASMVEVCRPRQSATRTNQVRASPYSSGTPTSAQQRLGAVEQRARLSFVQRELALVGQHQVVARDVQVHRLQHEPACPGPLPARAPPSPPAPPADCRPGQAGLQAQSAPPARPRAAAPRAKPSPTCSCRPWRGCQQRKRRQPQRAQQVGGKVREGRLKGSRRSR